MRIYYKLLSKFSTFLRTVPVRWAEKIESYIVEKGYAEAVHYWDSIVKGEGNADLREKFLREVVNRDSFLQKVKDTYPKSDDIDDEFKEAIERLKNEAGDTVEIPRVVDSGQYYPINKDDRFTNFEKELLK